MKISVIIPSRGRVRRLAAVLTSLDMLASGDNKITYGVCCDADDTDTQHFCEHVKKEIYLAYRVGPRPKSLGELFNDMALRMPADVYVMLCDDVLPLTPDWDKEVASAVKNTPHGVFLWDSALKEAFYPIITEKYRAAAGRLYTDHYPYWYDDLALIEQYIFTVDGVPEVLPIKLADKAHRTTRMRELSFWHDFYIATRAWRISEGRRIADELGLSPKLSEAMADELTRNFYKAGKDSLDMIEKEQGDPSPPDESYKSAKKRAEAVMALKDDFDLETLFSASDEKLWHLSNEHKDFAA